MKRVIPLFISLVFLLLPELACASGSYASGDIFMTAVTNSLEAGNQIWFTLGFSDDIEADATQRQEAFANLLSSVNIRGTAYTQESSMYGQISVNLENIELLKLNVLQRQDGAIQFASNLTGDMVFEIPTSLIQNASSLENVFYGSVTSEGSVTEEFAQLPAADRLKIATSDVIIMMMRVLLGWTSYNQIDMDGEFYEFDFEYQEPTDTRDGVAQRMFGKVTGDQFCALFWDIASMIDSDYGYFQRALADVLAENGVTRYQVRQVVDSWFPEIPIDPAEDFVQPSHAVPDDGELCKYDDISYFFKKLVKYTDKIWEESFDTPLTLIVSYDDYGQMVGLDAALPKFTETLPYEGDFTYSIHTDDDWQVLTTSKGQLKLDDDNNWLVGEYRHFNGEDVGGHNENELNAKLYLENRSDATVAGFGIDGEWTYDLSIDAKAVYTEKFSGNGILDMYSADQTLDLLSVQADGATITDGNHFKVEVQGTVGVIDNQHDIVFDAKMGYEEISEITMPTTEPIPVTDLDNENIAVMKQAIMENGLAVMMQILFMPEVSANFQSIFD